MKDIVFLLWVLIIPLFVMAKPLLYKIFNKQQNLLPKKEKVTFSKEELDEIWEVLFRFAGVLVVVPFFLITAFHGEHMPVSASDVLIFILIAEMLAFDFMTIVFYFKQEKSLEKKFLSFAFAFINFWTGVVWAIQGQIALAYLISSVICYPLFGLDYVCSYYLRKGRKNA